MEAQDLITKLNEIKDLINSGSLVNNAKAVIEIDCIIDAVNSDGLVGCNGAHNENDQTQK